MKKRLNLICVVAMCAFVFTGCAASMGGALYTNVKAPSTILHAPIDQNASAMKSAEGSCVSILGLIATGDSSVETITKKAGIKKIHHVDTQYTNVLGLFAKTTYKVYGE